MILPIITSAQSLSGTYSHSAQGVILTLVFKQDPQGNITGTLSSNAGARFQIEGIVQEGVGAGTCYNNEGGVFFEAHPSGNQLLFAMIEPGINNMPDYNNVRQFIFVKKGESVPGSQSKPGFGGGAATAPSAPGVEKPGKSGVSSSAQISDQEVGDRNWGFTFRPPGGWKWQKNNEGVILGHDKIPGMILVFPHTAATLPEVRSQMLEGLVEEDIHLVPAGQIQHLEKNILTGDYSGVVEGEQAKARGVGTLSPHGGGAFIVAATVPEKFGKQHTVAAEAIAKSMRYFKIEVSDLVSHFSGIWRGYTGGYGGGTLRNFTLASDGSYFETSETSYSMDHSSDGWSHNDAHTSAYGRGDAQGRWTVRGNKKEGVLVITYSNGSESIINYRVHVEKEETYWNEYWFNEIHYSKKR